jgi:hypothetical protein
MNTFDVRVRLTAKFTAKQKIYKENTLKPTSPLTPSMCARVSLEH